MASKFSPGQMKNNVAIIFTVVFLYLIIGKFIEMNLSGLVSIIWYLIWPILLVAAAFYMAKRKISSNSSQGVSNAKRVETAEYKVIDKK